MCVFLVLLCGGAYGCPQKRNHDEDSHIHGSFFFSSLPTEGHLWRLSLPASLLKEVPIVIEESDEGGPMVRLSPRQQI
jgi:hypothetical protein